MSAEDPGATPACRLVLDMSAGEVSYLKREADCMQGVASGSADNAQGLAPPRGRLAHTSIDLHDKALVSEVEWTQAPEWLAPVWLAPPGISSTAPLASRGDASARQLSGRRSSPADPSLALGARPPRVQPARQTARGDGEDTAEASEEGLAPCHAVSSGEGAESQEGAPSTDRRILEVASTEPMYVTVPAADPFQDSRPLFNVSFDREDLRSEGPANEEGSVADGSGQKRRSRPCKRRRERMHKAAQRELQQNAAPPALANADGFAAMWHESASDRRLGDLPPGLFIPAAPVGGLAPLGQAVGVTPALVGDLTSLEAACTLGILTHPEA
mmetsp:Transcript_19842/g.56835  ORF Transcript_19842/g.56835 Transcript_19842/m.56835 type:complete len:329 (-) Transcript_19842:267-1253(-)